MDLFFLWSMMLQSCQTINKFMKTIEIPNIFLYSPQDKMEYYLKSQTLIA